LHLVSEGRIFDSAALGSRLTIRTLATCLIVLSVLAVSDASQVEDPNTPLTAFKVHSSLSADQFRDFLEEVKLSIFDGIAVNAVMIRYRIVLLKGVPPSQIKSKLTRVLRDKDGSAQLIMIPLTKRGTQMRIPTGELIVQFKRDIDATRAVHILSSLNLRVIESPRKDTPGRYRVEDEKNDFLRLQRSAQKLAINDAVRFVEPDVLEIMNTLSESASPAIH
jgi:hypothetical protein